MNFNSVGEDEIFDRASTRERAMVIEIPKALTVTEAKSFRDAFKPFYDSEVPPSCITLDFSRNNFLDSSGIGALASIIKMSKIAGIELETRGVTEQVRSVLKMTRLDRLLVIETPEASVADSIHESLAGHSSQPACWPQV